MVTFERMMPTILHLAPSLCRWLWNRIDDYGTKSEIGQSLAVVKGNKQKAWQPPFRVGGRRFSKQWKLFPTANRTSTPSNEWRTSSTVQAGQEDWLNGDPLQEVDDHSERGSPGLSGTSITGILPPTMLLCGSS